MKVKFVERCNIDSALYRVGSILDLPKKEADKLIDSGKCVAVESKKKAKNRSVGLEASELETRVKTDAS
jgi:hypothetical protein